MNAVEIEEAVSALAERPFDRAEFPYAFLEAFGNKATTLKRLRSGASNKSDLGGVLQTNNIHIATCDAGEVTKTLKVLKASPATARGKAKFALATDGESLEAEDLVSGETIVCAYRDFPDHFGFFLPLAGITTVKQIRESSFDIKATGRLNRLYVELLKDNPDWGTAARRPDMNHFMARLIFCFFAEDTDIFSKPLLFTSTVQTMSASDSSNTQEVISTIFRAMNVKTADRSGAGIPRWADAFPYVNGGLFSGSVEVPRFSRIARSYLLHIGSLDWKKINPDIFGSMIQAVAEDEERGALGMHYTSVPNILKVLNPLFLDDLREKLAEAGDNPRKLLNLRNRMARIRVFDPACGSGNFLVIAYKEMRAIEAEINKRRHESGRKSDIPLTNFRGIELRDFPAEIARLALIIAEFQCDVLYRGQKEALQDFLPLDAENWITRGNALRLDWLSICPPTGSGVKLQADDLFGTPLDQAQIDFENEGGQTYICGNPPFLGGKKQNDEQKSDMIHVFGKNGDYKNLDYVSAFLMKAAETVSETDRVAFVTTSSVHQGTHVPTLWPKIFSRGMRIVFCHRPFQWSNNAANNAGVYVSIVGLSKSPYGKKYIFEEGLKTDVENINAYLIKGADLIVEPFSRPIANISVMITGNAAYDGGYLFFTTDEYRDLVRRYPAASAWFRRVAGTSEFNDGKVRWCLWIEDADLDNAKSIPEIADRIEGVLNYRRGGGEVAQTLVGRPHQFRYRHLADRHLILVPQVSAEDRPFLPVGFLDSRIVITHLAHVLYDGGLPSFALLSSKLHQIWVHTLAGRLGNGVRYSSNLCWNTFPVPTLTEKNKADLTRCAEDILLAREAHFPATIADLYDPDAMPDDLRAAHERNDEVLERIYIGRRFRNDTERLEKLFELYTRVTAGQGATKKQKAKATA